MSTQSISDSLISRAKAARQVLGIRFSPTALDPTPTPPTPTSLTVDSSPRGHDFFSSLFASHTATTTAIASGTSTTTTVPSGTPTTTPVPSVIVPFILPSHRAGLSVSIVTNSDSHTLASADSDTRINTPTSTSKSLTTFDTSTSPSAPTESSSGVTVGPAQPKGVPIGVITGASVAAAAVILVVLGLFCIRRRLGRKNTQVVVNPFDRSLATINVFNNSEPVEGIVTMERINILHSRSDGDVHHEGPNLGEVSPSSDAPRPRRGQRGKHPHTEAHPAWHNNAHILSPVSIHKPVISVNDVASANASSMSRAENIQGIDEQLAQVREDLPMVAGTAFQQVYREVVVLRREIDELRRSGADVPPAYPGNVYSSQ